MNLFFVYLFLLPLSHLFVHWIVVGFDARVAFLSLTDLHLFIDLLQEIQ